MHKGTARVRDYWNKASCGTERTTEPKYSLEYFEEIEDFRYKHEPYIHSFTQFTRWHGKRILEIGIGAGTDFLQFCRAGAKAYGVDLTEEAIKNVEHGLNLYGLQAEDVKVCNSEKLPYDDNAFDLVYSWGVIHHADNMEKVFSEIYRVAKPGGQIKIMVYNLNSMHAWYLYLRHAVLRGRFLKDRRWAVYNYQESYATKAYKKKEIIRLLSSYKHSDLHFSFWDQRIRRGARFEIIRTLIQKLCPISARWYMAFEFKKIASIRAS